MAWPKGKPRPDAFKGKKEVEKVIEPDLPISEKLSDVIAELKKVLTSYRHDIEIIVKEQSNVTTAITVTITFLTK